MSQSSLRLHFFMALSKLQPGSVGSSLILEAIKASTAELCNCVKQYKWEEKTLCCSMHMKLCCSHTWTFLHKQYCLGDWACATFASNMVKLRTNDASIHSHGQAELDHGSERTRESAHLLVGCSQQKPRCMWRKPSTLQSVPLHFILIICV